MFNTKEHIGLLLSNIGNYGWCLFRDKKYFSLAWICAGIEALGEWLYHNSTSSYGRESRRVVLSRLLVWLR